jgi:TonB family protein
MIRTCKTGTEPGLQACALFFEKFLADHSQMTHIYFAFILLTCLFTFSVPNAFSQTSQNDSVYVAPEQMPEPIGGFVKFYVYIKNNIFYPQKALDKKIQGYVFVQFIITEKGVLEDFEILRGIGYGCEEELLRVLSEADAWRAGKQNGKNVKTRFTLPVIFKLPEN